VDSIVYLYLFVIIQQAEFSNIERRGAKFFYFSKKNSLRLFAFAFNNKLALTNTE